MNDTSATPPGTAAPADLALHPPSEAGLPSDVPPHPPGVAPTGFGASSVHRATHRLPTPEDTRALGAALARVLRAGDLVVLTGRLGAGKTQLAQGIGAGLGVRGPVTSPTFVLARVHPPDPARGGRLPLVHVDAYRLGGVAEVDDLDLDADTDAAVTVVEWGGGLVERLADAHLEIRLTRDVDTEERTAELLPHGGDWPTRLAQLWRDPASGDPLSR